MIMNVEILEFQISSEVILKDVCALSFFLKLWFLQTSADLKLFSMRYRSILLKAEKMSWLALDARQSILLHHWLTICLH